MQKVLGGVTVIVIAAAIALTVRSNQEAKNLRQQVSDLEQQTQHQGQANPEEAKQLIEEIGKFIALPEGEEPTVATITDREKLSDVNFFAKAENGDKVIIYVNARKAYLYRPGMQKVIEVATLNLNASASSSHEGSPSSPPGSLPSGSGLPLGQ